MASTLLDPRVRKFKKFKEKEALNAINNAKKYIKSRAVKFTLLLFTLPNSTPYFVY